jgi:hypothetical protein
MENNCANIVSRSLFALYCILGFLFFSYQIALAGSFSMGPEACAECHEAEFKIWKKTKHFKSYRTAHREPKEKAKPSPKKILKVVGGGKRMKRNETCLLCHYTSIREDAEGKPKVTSGPSCESCHGHSSDWLKIHDNYGGKNVKRSDETADNKKQRFLNAANAGLIWPSMKYNIAENCMVCHGLANESLKAKQLADMLEAGHPINPDFELVKYSQGSIRHRYYHPEMDNNKKMNSKELSELFVVGHAAKLVSALQAISKSDNSKYKLAQKKRFDASKKVISLLPFPEAKTLLAAPNRDNAIKLSEAISGKDLTALVGKIIPPAESFK